MTLTYSDMEELQEFSRRYLDKKLGFAYNHKSETWEVWEIKNNIETCKICGKDKPYKLNNEVCKECE